MGALHDCHYDLGLENGINLGGCVELDFEQDPQTVVIEDAVKVLLEGLGEDINREGIRKTPLRVAKALREGTRGSLIFITSPLLSSFRVSFQSYFSLTV